MIQFPSPSELIRMATQALMYRAAWSLPLWVVLLLLAAVAVGSWLNA